MWLRDMRKKQGLGQQQQTGKVSRQNQPLIRTEGSGLNLEPEEAGIYGQEDGPGSRMTVRQGGQVSRVGAASAWLHFLIQKPLLDNNEAPPNICFGIMALSQWGFSLDTKQRGLNSGPALSFCSRTMQNHLPPAKMTGSCASVPANRKTLHKSHWT